MSSTCGLCTAKVSAKSPGLQCSGSCSNFYHAKCVGVPLKDLPALQLAGIFWKCEKCREDMSAKSILISEDDSTEGSNESCSIESIFKVVSEMKSEMNSLKNSQQEVIKCVSFCSDKISDFESLINELKAQSKKLEAIKSENASLKSQLKLNNVKLENLHDKVRNLEQYGRNKNLEIHGIDVQPNEHCSDIVLEVAKHVKVQLTEEDIDISHRIKTQNNNTQSIIVQFLNRKKRDELLKAKTFIITENNKIRGTRIGDQIFINENLSPEFKYY